MVGHLGSYCSAQCRSRKDQSVVTAFNSSYTLRELEQELQRQHADSMGVPSQVRQGRTALTDPRGLDHLP